MAEVAAMHSVAPVELADDDPFRNHKLRVGDCVAVCFDEGLFFGIVQEILVRDSANRIVTFFGDMSLQNRPPVREVPVCLAERNFGGGRSAPRRYVKRCPILRPGCPRSVSK